MQNEEESGDRPEAKERVSDYQYVLYLSNYLFYYLLLNLNGF